MRQSNGPFTVVMEQSVIRHLRPAFYADVHLIPSCSCTVDNSIILNSLQAASCDLLSLSLFLGRVVQSGEMKRFRHLCQTSVTTNLLGIEL